MSATATHQPIAAEKLAQWTSDCLINRRDVYGLYLPTGQALTGPPANNTPRPDRQHEINLLDSQLTAHFSGGDILGVHAIGLDDCCMWAAWDVDAHSDADNPEQNWRDVLTICERLEARSFRPLVTASNGRGGYHVRVIFAEPQPAAATYHFAREILGELNHEAFPKSESYAGTTGQCGGGYLRLPGKHHKRDYWSACWDGSRWLDWADSVDWICSFRGDDITLPEPPPKPEPQPQPVQLFDNSGDIDKRVRAYVDTVGNVTEGSRNTEAFTLAGKLRASFDLGEDQLRRYVSEWNQGNAPPLPQAELLDVIESSRVNGKQPTPRPRPRADYLPAAINATQPDAQPRQRPPRKRFTASDAISKPEPLRQAMIEGIARRGDVINLIAATKVGKTWLALDMALAFATGEKWLGRRMQCGQVLYLDAELDASDIMFRVGAIADQRNHDANEINNAEFVELRGSSIVCDDIRHEIETSEAKPDVVFVDAKYRFMGDMQENSNDDQTNFHNTVARLAKVHSCLIVLIHHSSKGDQSHKSTVDVGSGGGSQARTVDAHVTIRPHENPGMAVLDAAVRTFAKVEQQTIEFNWPCWDAVDDVAPVMAQPKTQGESKQEQKDREAVQTLCDIFSESPGEPLSRYDLLQEFGGGKNRLNRLIRLGITTGEIVRAGTRKTRNGKDTEMLTLSTDYAAQEFIFDSDTEHKHQRAKRTGQRTDRVNGPFRQKNRVHAHINMGGVPFFFFAKPDRSFQPVQAITNLTKTRLMNHEPTQQQIEAECQRIREGWSEEERRKRLRFDWRSDMPPIEPVRAVVAQEASE